MINQRDTADCGIAAIAMFTGLPYEQVRKAGIECEAFVHKKGTYCASKILRELGFGQANLGGSYVLPEGARQFINLGEHTYFHRHIAPHFIHKILWGRPALLSVPSLNKIGGWHFVYYDGSKVLDPQNGRRGKKFYTELEQLEPREIIMWSHAA